MILKTTDAQLHDIETAAQNTRKGSETVRVNKQALLNLLADHFTLNLAVKRKHGALPETTP